MVKRIFVKHDIKVGDLVPSKLLQNADGTDPDDTGALGRYFEDRLTEFGHWVNPGAGADLFEHVEVKARRMPSTSGIHIGSMTPDDIATNPYAFSNLHDKMQSWLLITVSKNSGAVSEVIQLDFTHPSIQETLATAYEQCRSAVKESFAVHGTCIKYYHKPLGCLLYLEREKDAPADRSYRWNLTDTGLKKLHSMALGVAKLHDKDVFKWP